MKAALAPAAISLAACNRGPLPAMDESLAREIAGIRAIDNHAHPVRYTGPGEPAEARLALFGRNENRPRCA